MSAERAYQLYFAIRLHFLRDYDVFEYGTKFYGRLNLTERNDFKLIHCIMGMVDTEKDVVQLCVANHLYGNPNMLYDEQLTEQNYRHWMKVKESLDYHLQKDLDHIGFECFKRKCGLDGYLNRVVVGDLLSQKVEYESIMLIDRKIGCMKHIQGFDSGKYIDRMVKASKFVAKGALGKNQSSQIDTFLTSLKGKSQ